jgi:hypothetical protein
VEEKLYEKDLILKYNKEIHGEQKIKWVKDGLRNLQTSKR